MFIACGPHRNVHKMNQMNVKAALRNHWPHQKQSIYSISVEFCENVDVREKGR